MPGQRFRFRNGLTTRGAVNIPGKHRGEIVGRGVVERSRISGVAAIEGASHFLQALRHANIRVANLAQRVIKMCEEAVYQILGDCVPDAAQRRQPTQDEPGVQRQKLEPAVEPSGAASAS